MALICLNTLHMFWISCRFYSLIKIQQNMATYNLFINTDAKPPPPDRDTIDYPPTPFVQPMRIVENRTIIIKGVPHQNPSRFTVYLQKSNENEPNIIGMCFDVRFNYGKDKNVIVTNHKQGGWGKEERHSPDFPFMPNQRFELEILVEPNWYKYKVNYQH
ncbi:galactose-binding lectin l-1-like [Ruditapes philippinarum]|uniref:galactose-binding lectin l-1-like n=1 Tax=Ruditapes philippinarum TaxID=129788 RepID=UPI00295BAB7B|nr:galactose-binding lectin l-1-like [Ruditapes philippinarum]